MSIRPSLFAVLVFVVSTPAISSAQYPVMQAPSVGGAPQWQVQGQTCCDPWQQPVFRPLAQWCPPVHGQIGGISPEGFPGVTAATPFGVDPVDQAPLIGRPQFTIRSEVVVGSEQEKLKNLLRAILTGQKAEDVQNTDLPVFNGLGLTPFEADALINAYLNQ